MKRKPDGWNIVLAANWNRAIFTPDWVNKHVFKAEELETLISVMPNLPIVYRDRDVSLHVASSRIIIHPRRLEDVCIKAAEMKAHTILSKLPDTPIIGVGVNFAFTESDPRIELARMFELTDSTSISALGWQVQSRRIIQQVKREDDVLNLERQFDGKEITFAFNFHTETTDNEVAQNAVKDRVIRLRDAAIELLDEAYKLILTEKDDEDE